MSGSRKSRRLRRILLIETPSLSALVENLEPRAAMFDSRCQLRFPSALGHGARD